MCGHLHLIHDCIDAVIIKHSLPNTEEALHKKKELQVGFNYCKSSKNNHNLFVCNRSGKQQDVPTTGQRTLRMKGVLQLNQLCPCYYSFHVCDSGQVNVKYCQFHSHDLNEAFVKLSDAVEAEIAEKLEVTFYVGKTEKYLQI